MADETMYDSAYPPGVAPITDCVLIYAGGDTPHTWTPAEIAGQTARFRLPGFVRSDPQNASYVQDANAMVRWLKAEQVPTGSLTFLDLETAVSRGYVSAYGYILNLEGYQVAPYGSLSTVWQNPHLNGLFVAHYTGRAHLCTPACGYGLNANALITQYANSEQSGGPWDLSLIDPSAPLWDTKPYLPTARPDNPSRLEGHDDMIICCQAKPTYLVIGSTKRALTQAKLNDYAGQGVPIRRLEADDFDAIAGHLATV